MRIGEQARVSWSFSGQEEYLPDAKPYPPQDAGESAWRLVMPVLDH